MAAHVHLSPEESRAIARFFVAVARVLIRMGYGWGALAALGVLGAGYAAWTAPTWWNWFRDWLEQ